LAAYQSLGHIYFFLFEGQCVSFKSLIRRHGIPACQNNLLYMEHVLSLHFERRNFF